MCLFYPDIVLVRYKVEEYTRKFSANIDNNMLRYVSPNKHGYAVRFSPFHKNWLALVENDNFGFAGTGSLVLLEIKNDRLIKINQFDYSTNLYDVVFSETSDNVCVTSSSNGTIQVWNINDEEPAKVLLGHSGEVYTLNWSKNRLNHKLLSGSWDGLLKVWDVQQGVCVFTVQDNCLIQNASWSPYFSNTFANTSSNGYLKIWDGQNLITSFKVHDGECLCVDWNKYDENLVGTGGSDGFVRVWDIRQVNQPLFQFIDSMKPLRRIQFSPYSNTVIVSISYDFSTKVFDWDKSVKPVEIFQNHSEFVYGLDWSNFNKNQIVDCGWDSLVNVFTANNL